MFEELLRHASRDCNTVVAFFSSTFFRCLPVVHKSTELQLTPGLWPPSNSLNTRKLTSCRHCSHNCSNSSLQPNTPHLQNLTPTVQFLQYSVECTPMFRCSEPFIYKLFCCLFMSDTCKRFCWYKQTSFKKNKKVQRSYRPAINKPNQ